jgi:transposase
MFQYRQVLVRMRAGDSLREIARMGLMGRDRAAELRALAQSQGWLTAGSALPDDASIAAALAPAKRAKSTLSSVEAHRQRIGHWFAAGVGGRAMHAALCREHGFTGSYSAVMRMLVQLRGQSPPEATVRLHFAAGEAAQVDFGAGPILTHPDGTPRRTWAFVMTLAYSRHQYVEFVWDQSVATWLGCHRRAFEWFGGVPQRLIIDNAKCAIIKASRHDPLVQRSYAECAEAYGFKIDPCPPGDPQKKGIVESGIKYLKGNFLPTRTFRDLSELNSQVERWVMQEAGRRCHGTTRQAPLAMFATERSLLKPLPAIAPDLARWQRVVLHRDCHVQHERAYYSAPFALIGKTLWLRATDTTVALFEDYRHVCTHLRAHPGERMTVGEHLPPDARHFFAHDRQWCLKQAQAVGDSCVELIELLLGERIVERLRAAQGVLALAKRYGPLRLEGACARALLHASPHYRTVKTMLASGADLQPLVTDVHETPQTYAHARFARSAASLFSAPEASEGSAGLH